MRVPWGYLKRVLAGAIFGMYMSHLLYFLNPQIDITPARLGTVTIAYALICGLLFGTALWAARLIRVRLFGRPDIADYRRHGFGWVVAAAFVSAAVYWMHLVAFRIYLPIGAVRVLSKASNIIVGTAFALLILWIFERSARRNVSRGIFLVGVILIAVSSFFLYQRRENYRTDTRTVVVANVGIVAGERPVVVVAIRNLPFDWLVTLVGEGNLPFFERMSRNAFMTRVEPFTTTSPKAIWASLATGQLPNRHGVTGRFSYETLLNAPGERFLILPSGIGFRAWGLIPPVRRISAQLPAGQGIPFWTMFERLGFQSSVVNWPSALPSRGGATRMIGDSFFDHPRDPATIFPPSLAADTARQRLSPKQFPDSVRTRFDGVSRATRDGILHNLAEDLTALRLTDRSLGAEDFALNVVALEGLADALRVLRLDSNVLPGRTSASGEAVRVYLEQLDRALAELQRSAPGAIILIVSPSGPQAPTVPADAVALFESVVANQDPGRDDGFLIITGEGIVNRANAQSAQVVDIGATALFAAGLPIARDLDGRVTTEAFGDQFLRDNSLSIIQTYAAEKLVVHRPASD
ncbi:MAG: hypothetical protein ABI718_05425 [Acidobacteriota bacterium]